MTVLTKEERFFLLEILDQVRGGGIAAKTMVVVIMGKLSEEVPDIPAPDVDAAD